MGADRPLLLGSTPMSAFYYEAIIIGLIMGVTLRVLPVHPPVLVSAPYQLAGSRTKKHRKTVVGMNILQSRSDQSAYFHFNTSAGYSNRV